MRLRMKYLLRNIAVISMFFVTAVNAQWPGLQNALPGDDTITGAAADQTSPWISSGGGSQLMMWADERANPNLFGEYETSSDIYAVRLGADGVPIDTVPFAVTAGPGSQSAPRAAWNGTHWLVVFRTTTLTGTGFYYQSSLAAVRIAADGTVLDTDPIPLPGTGSGGWDVASDGSGWVVASVGNDISGDIIAMRIDATGAVLDPPTRSVVADSFVDFGGVRLTYAGGRYLLAFPTSNGTGAVLFDSLLQPVGPSAPFLLVNRSISDLSSNDSEFYVTWQVQRADFSLAVMGSRVDIDGNLLDGSGVDISAGESPFGNIMRVAWDGIRWRVAWNRSSDNLLRIAAVNADGSVANPGGIAVANAQAGPMAGTGNGGVHVSWIDFLLNEYDVFAATVDSAGTTLHQGVVGTGQPRQVRSDLAAGSSGYLSVWRSESAGALRVMAQPLDGSGNAIGAGPLELAAGTTLEGPGSPAVAWNGSVYLVAWGNGSGIVAQRIGENGNLLDPIPVLLTNNGFGPVAVAAVGNDFLVVGRRFGFTIQNIFPVGVRISGVDGSVLDAEAVLLGSSASSPFTVYARTPAITALADRWLIGWHTNITHDDPLANTVGVFMDANGQLSNTFELHGYFSTNGGNALFTIALASDGTSALFVQSQELTSGVETDLIAHLVSADGTVEPMINLTPWRGNQYRPAITFDGRDYIVAFQDQKNRLGELALDQIDARSDLYGMRITVDGTVIDPQGFLIDDSPLAETDLAIATRGTETLIAASQMRHDGTASNYRIALSDVVDSADRFPVTQVSATPASGDVSLNVLFSSAGSVDPEGGPLAFLWNFGDGSTSTLADPAHDFITPGAYPVRLTTTDSTGRTSAQSVMVSALPVNQAPVAVASADRLSGPAPLSLIARADGSYDPDGALGNIEWTSSDGRNSFGSPAYFTFSNEGTFTLTLTVNDSRGATSTDTLTVEVGGVNQPPTAMASATPTTGSAPLAVAFSAAGSSDTDGSILSYTWDFGDGVSGSGASPTHIYTSIGSYTAMLTVTDNSGASASDSVIITVDGVSGTALQSQIDMSTSSKRGVSQVHGAVTVRNGNGGTEQSASVYARWILPDGTVQSAGQQYTDRKGIASFSHSIGDDGTYTLRIDRVLKSGFVYDPQGGELEDSITIGNVNPGDTTPPAAPTGLSATAGDSQVSLTWSDNTETDLAHYRVERATSATGPFVDASGPITASTFVDTGLFNGTAYTYRVLAIDTSGNASAPSSIVSATPEGGGDPAASLHVGSLVLSTSNAGKGAKMGQARVTVLDNNGTPVAGAQVQGTFTGSFNETVVAVSGPSGVTSLETTGSTKGGVSFTFCVDSVVVAGLTYDEASNTMTCGQF